MQHSDCSVIASQLQSLTKALNRNKPPKFHTHTHTHTAMQLPREQIVARRNLPRACVEMVSQAVSSRQQPSGPGSLVV